MQYHTIGSAQFNSADDSHRDAVPAGSLKWHVGLEDGHTGGFGTYAILLTLAVLVLLVLFIQFEVNVRVSVLDSFCVAGRVTIDDDGLTVHHYAGNGTVVFTAPTVGPRNVSKTARLHAEKTVWERD